MKPVINIPSISYDQIWENFSPIKWGYVWFDHTVFRYPVLQQRKNSMENIEGYTTGFHSFKNKKQKCTK